MPDKLKFEPAMIRFDLISPSIITLLNQLSQKNEANEVLVAEIDPTFAGGYDFCKKYEIPFNQGANCVIVEATRGEKRVLAACLSLVGYNLCLNKVVRKTLNARRVSLAPLAEVLEQTQMEYGSITALGLPKDWLILIDARLTHSSHIVMGSGLLKSKLLLPTSILLSLPNTCVVDGLAYAS